MSDRPRTRLDPLVKWKEREVERAKLALAERLKALAAAQARIAEASQKLQSVPSGATTVDDLDLFERAAARARSDLSAAKAQATAAEAALAASQEAFADVNRRVEMFRRANERQRTVLIQEIEKRERKTLDELANLLRKR